MGSLVTIGKAGGLAEGKMMEVTAQGREIMLIKAVPDPARADRYESGWNGNWHSGRVDGRGRRLHECPVSGLE